jgi:hypothetical protein
MDNKYTHITYVMDRSGSMMSCWDDVRGGFETFIKEQKAEDGKCTFSLHAFDTQHEKPITFGDIKIVTENIDELGIGPRGGTALYDAIGQAINETGAKLRAMSEKERPGKVLIVVQTDGWENASKEFKADAIKKLVEQQENDYSWKFMFLGANLDSVNDATMNLGFKADMSAVYDTKNTDKMYDTFNAKTKCLRAAVNVNSVDLSYSDAERSALAD